MLTERIIEALRYAYETEGKEVTTNDKSVPRLPPQEVVLPRQVR